MFGFWLATGGLGEAPASLIPPAADSVIEDMRPGYRSIATLVVDPSGNGDYTTIQAALDAVPDMQVAQAVAEGVSFGVKGILPYYRVDIVIMPGTYVETIETGGHVALYSHTGIQGDVTVVGDTAGPLGALVSFGSCYIENIDFRRTGIPGANPKYPNHHASGHTNIFARCRYYADVVSTEGGWTAIGMDGSENATSVWYQCRMESNEFGPGSRSSVGLHGFGGAVGASTYILVECYGDDLGYDALSSAPDIVWAVDNDANIISASGTNTTLHANGNGSASVTYEGPFDTNRNWPVPINGLSAQDYTYYFGA